MWSSSLSLPLWIPGPGQSLRGDVAGRLPEGVSTPCGLPLCLFPCGFQVRVFVVMVLAGFLRVSLLHVVFFSFSSPVDSRSESSWRYCWQASRGSLLAMWSFPLSLPLWIPGQSLPGDVAVRLPGGVASPTLGLPLFLSPCGLQATAW